MIYKKHLIMICSLFLFLNCKEEVKTTFSEINISTQNNSIVEINIPEANGIGTIASKINSEIQKQIITALHIGDPDKITPKSVEEGITTFIKEYNTFKTNFPETLPEWEAQIDSEIMFQSPEIISIAITSYINTGGAHGALHISFLNFKTETGELINNSTLINNVDAFKNLAKTYFDITMEEKEQIFNTDTFKLPINMAYSKEGIVLLYNTYEIAPYSTGVIEFTIPFNEAKPYLVFNSL